MVKDYLTDISAEKQWDIILQVTRFGDYTQVIKLVKDGYKVTVELMELLYRLGAKNVIESILSYDEDVYNGEFLKSSKMSVLENMLGKARADELIEKLMRERKQHEESIEREKNERLLARLSELYDMFGLTDAFFESIVSSYELMVMAAKTYDRKTVAVELSKHTRSDYFYNKNFSPFELIEYGLYDRALDGYLLFCNYDERLEVVKRIAQTDEGLELLLKRYTGIADLRTKEYLGLIMAQDKEVRERSKNYGDCAYSLLHANKVMTEREFEIWCKINPNMVVLYKLYNKNLFWVLKNGYLKYLLGY